MPNFSFKKIVSKEYLAKFIIIALFYILSVGILIYGTEPHREVFFKEGEVSPKDIYAPYNVIVTTEIDEAKTKQLLEEKAKELPVFFLKAEKTDKIISENINSLFDSAASLKASQESLQDKLLKLKQSTGVPVTESTLRFLLEYEDIANLKTQTNQILNELLNFPIIKEEDKKMLKSQAKSSIIIFDEAKKFEQTFVLENLLSVNESRDFVKNLKTFNSLDQRLKVPIIEVLSVNIQPTIFLDSKFNKERQEQILKNIPPVYKQLDIKKNELIIEKGRRFAREHILILKQLFKAETLQVYLKKISGVVILVFIWIFLCLCYFRIFEKEFFSQQKLLLLVATVTLLLTLTSKLISLSGLSVYITPVSLGTMLISLLVNSHIAFICGFLISILAGLSSRSPLSTILIYLIGNLTAVIFMVKARRRAMVLRAGLLVGLFQAISILASLLFEGQLFNEAIMGSLYGFLGGFLSGVIMLALLPVFEYGFGLTTNISLLELSDLNHPLLKELAANASGTYHHSLIVGNLAEAACDAIDANSLLARVGSYYHDIGKLHMSRYFSENQPQEKDGHEKLTPTISKIIIANHVKEGVELGRKYKLNEDIIKFIREHHGTSLMHYFYKKALEETEDVESLRDEAFRYSGPKPQSKEAAIVLLADVVEAASRSLEEPTPARLNELVHDLINNKFIDGQLDECNLTLKDINKIAASFLRVLLGIFHTRVEYPSGEDGSLKISIEGESKPKE